MKILSESDLREYNKKLFSDGNPNLENLKDAIQKENLVVFWGAGISSLGGCETWTGLTVKLIERLTTERMFNYAEQEGMIKISHKSLRTAITICRARVKEKTGNLKLFYDSILSCVEPSPDKVDKFNRIHNAILAFRARFYITTNIDLGAEQEIEENQLTKRQFVNLTNTTDLESRQSENGFVRKADLILDLTKNETVFYLHGTKKLIEYSIFSDENYNDFYTKDYIDEFLKEIFSGKYTFLFLGYSLSDQEILSNIFTRLKKEYKDESPRHYSLIPIYASDLQYSTLNKEYLNIYSIQPLYYLIDYNSYDGLFEILENLRTYKYLVTPIKSSISSLDQMEKL